MDCILSKRKEEFLTYIIFMKTGNMEVSGGRRRLRTAVNGRHPTYLAYPVTTYPWKALKFFTQSLSIPIYIYCL